MKTREQLVARALAKNKVVGAGQSASAEVSNRVDAVVDPVMSDLGTRGIFAWGDEDELPDDAFEHLADILAYATAEDFGKPRDEARRLMAEKRLRELEPYQLSGQRMTPDYF